MKRLSMLLIAAIVTAGCGTLFNSKIKTIRLAVGVGGSQLMSVVPAQAVRNGFGVPIAASQEPPAFQLAEVPLFATSDHPDEAVSQMGWVGGALLLPEDRLVFVDGSAQAVHFINLTDASRTTVEAEGPRQEALIRLVDRLPGGRVATVNNQRLRILDSDGAIASAMQLGTMPHPVAVFSDGTIIERRRVGSDLAFSMGSDGPYRREVRYRAQSPESARSVELAGALGDEETKLTLSIEGEPFSTTTRVVFGHRLLDARLHESLVVAQTDLDVVLGYDREGRSTLEIPMPPRRVRLSSAQVAAQRQVRMAETKRDRMTLREREHVFAYAAAALGKPITLLGVDSARTAQAEANEVAPPIDRIFADLNDRLWLRLFPMPEDRVSHWWVWDPQDSTYGFSLVLPRGKRLLDAVGNRVLVQVTDDGGRDELQLVEITRIP